MINPLDLSGRNILVTGASSGIGREAAISLSALGATLILVARREKELKKTQKLLCGNNHQIAVFDMTKFDEVPCWLHSIVSKCGNLSGLVHCAGKFLLKPLRFTTIQEIEDLFRINVYSAMILAKAFRQKDVHTDNASIVFLSSVAGIVGDSGLSSYSATKGAIIALTKSLAMEFSRDKIRVNCIAPASVQTAMLDGNDVILTEEQKVSNIDKSPLGIGTPKDVANAIAFLLSNASHWITGTTITVDGGYTAH